jgi:hypothetical protein
MKRVGIFLAGFASGWLVRSTVDSSRGLVVGAVAAAYGTVERLKRLVAIEREHLEDLIAEGKAKYQADRKAEPTAEREQPIASAPVAEIPRRGRAA